MEGRSASMCARLVSCRMQSFTNQKWYSWLEGKCYKVFFFNNRYYKLFVWLCRAASLAECCQYSTKLHSFFTSVHHVYLLYHKLKRQQHVIKADLSMITWSDEGMKIPNYSIKHCGSIIASWVLEVFSFGRDGVIIWETRYFLRGHWLVYRYSHNEAG